MIEIRKGTFSSTTALVLSRPDLAEAATLAAASITDANVPCPPCIDQSVSLLK